MKYKMLKDYYEIAGYEEDEDYRYVLVKIGDLTKKYKYKITLSPDVPDSRCCKVVINKKTYYFGD